MIDKYSLPIYNMYSDIAMYIYTRCKKVICGYVELAIFLKSLKKY